MSSVHNTNKAHSFSNSFEREPYMLEVFVNWSDGVRQFVIESVKQSGWLWLPVEMAAVTGEQHLGSGL